MPVMLWQERVNGLDGSRKVSELAEAGISVGIIGHRPNRLPAGGIAAVAADMRCLLDAIASVRRDNRPWAITNLAEGADRIGAIAALAAGYRLKAILPFAPDDYERDFPSSVADFAALLAAADAVIELPGCRASADKAYEDAGLAVLTACDILLAVWDGGASRGRGGTTEMIQQAIARDLTVLHVDAAGLHEPVLLHAGPSAGTILDAIGRAIS